MKKVLLVFLAILLFTISPAASAENAVDVLMDGKGYHLVMTSIGLVDGQLTIVMNGFGSTMTMGANGPKVAGMPEAHIGDDIYSVQKMHMQVGADFTFTFDLDRMPDEVVVVPYDGGETPVLWTSDTVASDTEAAAGLPEEVAGEWSGIGTPKNGGPTIELSVNLNKDGTGEYVFLQSGYRESRSITVSYADNTFSVAASGADGGTDGTWSLSDGKLILDITAHMPGGRDYTYVAELERSEQAESTPDEEPAEETNAESVDEAAEEAVEETNAEPAEIESDFEKKVDEVIEKFGSINDVTLLSLVSKASGDPVDNYLLARAYAEEHGMIREFLYTQSSMLADENAWQLRKLVSETTFETGSYTGYGTPLPDEVREYLSDAPANPEVHSAIWLPNRFKERYGCDFSEFVPSEPRPGYCMFVLDAGSYATPTARYDADIDKLMNYLRMVYDQINEQAKDLGLTFTGNPDLASNVICIRLTYTNDGKYGAAGQITAYGCTVKITLERMVGAKYSETLKFENHCGNSISTSITSGTFWLYPPDVDVTDSLKALAELAAEDTFPMTAVPSMDSNSDSGDAAIEAESLNGMDESGYSELLAYLEEGNVIEAGEKSDNGRALQQLICDLGGKISVDGQVGKKTIAALNDIRAALGMETGESIGADDLKQMLLARACIDDPDSARDIVPDWTDSDFNYFCGSALAMCGSGYRAAEYFEASDRSDAADKAAACALPFPKNGEIYRNKAYSGSRAQLWLKVDSIADGRASMFKVYAENGDLVSSLFLNGTGKVTVKLPAGTYVLKMGTGTKWYGTEDAFGNGSDAYYEVMTFENETSDLVLKSGYRSTITINTSTSDANSENVESEATSWEAF